MLAHRYVRSMLYVLIYWSAPPSSPPTDEASRRLGYFSSVEIHGNWKTVMEISMVLTDEVHGAECFLRS
jgi:hypothetical protein